jgi:hypothetical protein
MVCLPIELKNMTTMDKPLTVAKLGTDKGDFVGVFLHHPYLEGATHQQIYENFVAKLTKFEETVNKAKLKYNIYLEKHNGDDSEAVCREGDYDMDVGQVLIFFCRKYL